MANIYERATKQVSKMRQNDHKIRMSTYNFLKISKIYLTE